MWIKGQNTGLVAQVANPSTVHSEWDWGMWNDERVDIRRGFLFPKEWRGLPGTDCFLKKWKYWKGLKVIHVSSGFFETV